MELWKLLRSGELQQLWEIACETEVQFNLVRCLVIPSLSVWQPSLIHMITHLFAPDHSHLLKRRREYAAYLPKRVVQLYTLIVKVYP